MTKCPHCGALNEPNVCFCVSSKRNVHYVREQRPAPLRAVDGSGNTHPQEQTSVDLLGSTLLFGVMYFGISLFLGFIAFAGAWGAALSDSYVGSSPASSPITVVIAIMHAPVFLLLWVARLAGYDIAGPTIAVALMLVWSFVLGWIRAKLKQPRPAGGDQGKRDEAIDP